MARREIKGRTSIKFYLNESLEEIEKNELSNSENQGENYGDNNSEVMATEPSPLDDLPQKFHQENQYKLSGKKFIYLGYFSLHTSRNPALFPKSNVGKMSSRRFSLPTYLLLCPKS